jgi:hypothetical protein
MLLLVVCTATGLGWAGHINVLRLVQGGPDMAQQGFESLVPEGAARGMSSAEMLASLPFFSKLLHEVCASCPGSAWFCAAACSPSPLPHRTILTQCPA